MKLIIPFLLVASAFGQQTQPPGQLNMTIDQPCASYLLSCISQVNGKPVCAYGRVAYYPLPGQPFVYSTYPKYDPQGVPIDLMKCVSTLPGNAPYTTPGWDTDFHF